MLRKSIIMMALAAAFTMNVSAVQIEVPAGQPPMPGADASIPANAYENYRAGKLSNYKSSDIVKAKAKYQDKLDKMVANGKLSKDKLDAEAQRGYNQIDLAANESTVILLHDQDNNIRASMPAAILEGDYLSRSRSNEKEDLQLLTERNTLFMLGSNVTDILDIVKAKADQKGQFLYPEITEGTWFMNDKFLNQNNPMMGAVVRLKEQPNRPYIVGIAYRNHPVTEKMEQVMSNYIIPSIHSLDDMDSYSETITWENLTYRIPKGMKLKAQRNLDNTTTEVREYVGPSARFSVLRWPVKVDNLYGNFSFKKVINASKVGQPLSNEALVQSASVWNNGVPSYMIDNYQKGKKSKIHRVLRDDKYYYAIDLLYTDGAAPYSHIQLRNTVEFSDFGNVKLLRKKSVNISNKNKTKKDKK